MDCQGCREIVSADLDREASPRERRAAERHQDGCAACRRWADLAAVVTRRTRTRLAETAPDLIETVLAAREQQQPGRAPRHPHPAPERSQTPADRTGRSEHLTAVPTTTPDQPWPACGCAATCGCGCQQGQSCRCAQPAA